ncbi:hypothetical protein Pmani_011792 [Petrolisthes manimaculis]|uniref:Uncharacterized protein n=1 Tax=Petrolisthes manimaculis TaxID=1843537 RepID=A0AAE1Q0D8_9EUCA|nr:hypothetical protein Pmani_011792 [Petrolisthes manimaculis]
MPRSPPIVRHQVKGPGNTIPDVRDGIDEWNLGMVGVHETLPINCRYMSGSVFRVEQQQAPPINFIHYVKVLDTTISRTLTCPLPVSRYLDVLTPQKELPIDVSQTLHNSTVQVLHITHNTP